MFSHDMAHKALSECIRTFRNIVLSYKPVSKQYSGCGFHNSDGYVVQDPIIKPIQIFGGVIMDGFEIF